jgi:hypothetical protein
MRRLFPRITGAVLVASATSIALTSGCADNDSSLFIIGVFHLEAPDCTATPDGNAEIDGGGLMDLAFTREFQAVLLVGNQLAPRGEKDHLRTETARITLRGAEVTVVDALGEEIAPAFTVAGTGFVTVDQSEDPGFGAIGVALVPSPIGDSLAQDVTGFLDRMEIVVNVRVFGDTLGGKDIESSELSFPITVCAGCSILYHGGGGNSSCVATADADALAQPCFPGQGFVDCLSCVRDAADTRDICAHAPDLGSPIP